MPIQLDKILADISAEKALHPNYPRVTKTEIDDAWVRVGKNNKLSVHEARSIFKVLQKKYEQEKSKRTPSWKLFDIMEKIHKKPEAKPEVKAEDEVELPMEEDEEYEMLEVQEEEEQGAAQATTAPKSTGSNSDGESPSKSAKSSHSSTTTPDKDEKVSMLKTNTRATTSAANAQANPATEEKKLLNSMALTTRTATAQSPTAATAAVLQKKGITLRKTTAGSIASNSVLAKQAPAKVTPERGGGIRLEVGKTIQLPESIKRKLSEEHAASTPQSKKMNIAQAASQAAKSAAAAAVVPQPSTTTATQLAQVKHENEEPSPIVSATTGINLITIPAASNMRAELANGLVSSGGPSSSTAATVASTSTNGYSPRIEDIDFRNDIIFDTNGNGGGLVHKANNTADIINLGNFDNSLPPTFFKNLCNSSRHEALGLYVANVMNRLQARSAAKLELGILRAIIDVQSDDLEQ